MSTILFSNVSDNELLDEYNRRFTLKAGDRITDSNHAALHLRSLFVDDLHREKFVVLFLNGRNQIISSDVMFEGTLTSSAVYPREVIRKIIEHGAAAVILAHNHPSGNPNPSKDDTMITDKIKNACATIDVAVHDHLIIAGNSYTSLADKGLM